MHAQCKNAKSALVVNEWERYSGGKSAKHERVRDENSTYEVILWSAGDLRLGKSRKGLLQTVRRVFRLNGG